MTPKIGASIEAIRAISHQFAQRQTAIRWLEWLHRKLSKGLNLLLGAQTEACTGVRRAQINFLDLKWVI
jgi:hypothetical protein